MQPLLIPNEIPAGISVWQIDLTHAHLGYEEAEWAVLSPAEQIQAKRYLQFKDYVRFIKVRAALRKLLSQRLMCSPKEVCFQTSQYGKPYLQENAIHHALSFNVSHSGDFALIALSTIGDVGIDIEYCNPSIDIHQLADLVLTKEEYQSILASHMPLYTFFQHWVGKEAVLKALGLGIGKYLQHISLFPEEDGRYRLCIGDIQELKNRRCMTYQLTSPEGYTAALTWLD